MKNLTILILAILALSTRAQIPAKVMTAQDKLKYQAGFEKFYGTWVYEENGKSFTVILRFQKNERLNAPFLVGSHSYIEGTRHIDGDTKLNTITSWVFSGENRDKISFRFRETNNAVRAKGTVEFKDGNLDLMSWNLTLTEGAMVYVDGVKPDYKLHVPKEIALKKVKL